MFIQFWFVLYKFVDVNISQFADVTQHIYKYDQN
jgi:hypothetical protein